MEYCCALEKSQCAEGTDMEYCCALEKSQCAEGYRYVSAFSLKSEWVGLDKKNTPSYRTGMGGGKIKGQHIILTGGKNRIGRATDSVWTYNYKAQFWDTTTLPRMKSARYSHGCLIRKNKVFVFGGRNNWGRALSSVEVLDLKRISKGWVSLPPMKVARVPLATAVVGSTIYIFGSEFSPKKYNRDIHGSVEAFNVKSKAWNDYRIPSIPKMRNVDGSFVRDGKINLIVSHMKRGKTPSYNLMVFDVSSSSWRIDYKTLIQLEKGSPMVGSGSNALIDKGPDDISIDDTNIDIEDNVIPEKASVTASATFTALAIGTIAVIGGCFVALIYVYSTAVPDSPVLNDQFLISDVSPKPTMQPKQVLAPPFTPPPTDNIPTYSPPKPSSSSSPPTFTPSIYPIFKKREPTFAPIIQAKKISPPPSSKPSRPPSSKPSRPPSSKPSRPPPSKPSRPPSSKPSRPPSSKPSLPPLNPTQLESMAPSYSPSSRPSVPIPLCIQAYQKHICSTFASCFVNKDDTGVICTCRLGYEGDGRECRPLDECLDAAINDCPSKESGGYCVDLSPGDGRYKCGCDPRKGVRDGPIATIHGPTTCIDVCDDNDCDENADCINHSDGLSYSCRCPEDCIGTGLDGDCFCMPEPEYLVMLCVLLNCHEHDDDHEHDE